MRIEEEEEGEVEDLTEETEEEEEAGRGETGNLAEGAGDDRSVMKCKKICIFIPGSKKVNNYVNLSSTHTPQIYTMLLKIVC